MTANPAGKVAEFLRAEKADLIARKKSPSKVALIDRLLSAECYLSEAWDDLLAKCPAGKQPDMICERWQLVVDHMIDVAIDYTPEKIKASRDALKIITEENDFIAIKAIELAELLRKRDDRRVHGGIAVPEDKDPIVLLHRAAESSDATTHYLFEKYIWPTLDGLNHRFDGKYWPNTADVLDALAEAQFGTDPAPIDRLTAAALEVNQAGIRDFMRALDQALLDLAPPFYVGREIVLSHKAYAALCNALLGLDDDVSEGAVKSYRAQSRIRNTR